jgi:hypothetical protein
MNWKPNTGLQKAIALTCSTRQRKSLTTGKKKVDADPMAEAQSKFPEVTFTGSA